MKKKKINKNSLYGKGKFEKEKKLIGQVKLYLNEDIELEVAFKILEEFKGENINKKVDELGKAVSKNVTKFFVDEIKKDEKPNIQVIKCNGKEELEKAFEEILNKIK